MDRWRKTHPWRARLLHDVESKIEDGEPIKRAAGTMLMARTRREMQAWVDAMREEHGHEPKGATNDETQLCVYLEE